MELRPNSKFPFGDLLLKTVIRDNFTEMVGTIGSGLVASGKHRLTTNFPRLTLSVLPKLGETVTLTWTGAASPPLTRVTRTASGLELETAGTTTQVLLRSWPIPAGRRRDTREYTIDRMICPRCDSSRNILQWDPEAGWGCRGKNCLDLDFPVRHQLRWCPSIRRRQRLLRKLARVSPRGLKARLLRAQIAQQEAAMLANMKRANHDLTKRVKRHGGRRRASSG